MSKKKVVTLNKAIFIFLLGVTLYGILMLIASEQRNEQRRVNQQLIGACCETLFFDISDSSSSKTDRSSWAEGSAFTDPSYEAKMTDEWKKQPIKYAPWAKGADIAISLDQHLYPVLLPVIQKYEKQHGLKIAVQEGTCGISAGAVIHKQVDIAGYCCPPGDIDRMPGLQYHTIGLSPIGILVHHDNPFSNLSLQTIRDIFRGKYFKWSELKTRDGNPGPDMFIQSTARLHCKNRPGHWRLLLDNENLFSTRLVEISTISDMLSQVASNRGAIGYEVLWNIKRYERSEEIRFLLIDGFSPAVPEDLINHKYPLYRAYNLSTWHGQHLKNKDAQKLAAYLLKAVEDVDPDYGIIPVSRFRQSRWKFKGNELVGEPR